MSDEARSGKVLRQTPAAFWKELILLAVSVLFVLQPELIYGWIEVKTGAEFSEDNPIDQILQGLGLLGAFYAVVIGIGYDLLANRYILTDEEIIEIYGLIQKNRKVTRLEHIRSVNVEIGFMGRIFGFGDVLYYTAGSGGVDVRLRDISNPEALAKEADDLVKKKREGRGRSSSSTDAGAGNSFDMASEEAMSAFNDSQVESVNIQRQILQTLIELRDEARMNRGATRDEPVRREPAWDNEETEIADQEQSIQPGWATPDPSLFEDDKPEPKSERAVHPSLR